jgi:hypothetical protein
LLLTPIAQPSLHGIVGFGFLESRS